MERRTAQISAISLTVTLATACIAVAAVASGLFAEAASPPNPGVKMVEKIDDYIVVRTTGAETTVAPVTIAVEPAATEPAALAAVPEPVEVTQPLTTSAPQTTTARPPRAVPAAVAAPQPQPTAKPDHSADGGERNPVDRHPDGTIAHQPESDDHTGTDD
ncbi:MAG: hypothetical protein ABI706_01675 [Ilumatobacteraceae bacterium]